jgi:predicted AlkP superfamily phosphohydrolase/phosphomutase
MICRTLSEARNAQPIQTFPSSILNKYKTVNSRLLLFHGFPSKRQLASFVKSCHERTSAEAELGLKVLKNEKWDLFFTYFSAIDAIQHTFWSYYDEKHPDYPGENPYHDTIRNFYVLCDRVVARFLKNIDSGTTLILLSDHGHGTRPTKMVRINEILRRKSFLFPKTGGLKNRKRLIQPEFTKRVLSDLVNRFGVGHSSLKLMQKFPVWKKMFTSPASIDWERTVAYVSDLSALKSYSYGGVMINKMNLNDREYQEIRHRLISELKKIEEPVSGENLMKWVRPREELYQGNYLDKYPDILFELKEEYGISWDLGGEICTAGYMHKIQPGSHKMQSPVLLISNKDDHPCVKKDCTLMDIAPTVLSLLGIENSSDFEGSSIVRGNS